MPQERKGRNGGTLKSVAKGDPPLNPKGRGKGRLNNKTILEKWLGTDVVTNNPVTGEKERMSALDAITVALIGVALKGDHKAYRELMDRMEGKPRQRAELTGEEGGPIQQEISHDVDYDKLDSDTLRKIKAARTHKNG
jgi:hypothetical protein